MSVLPLIAALLLVQAPEKTLPPLTPEQSEQLRTLVRTTHDQGAALKSQLDEKQKALADLFAEYELKERQARKLEEEIIDLQRQLLANHHKMQVEIRTIVGKERFDILRQRVGRIVPAPGAKEPEPPPPRKPEPPK